MFWRLFGTFAALILLAIGGLGLVIGHRVEAHELQRIEATLRSKAILVEEAVRGRATDPATLQQQVVGLRQKTATRITLIADDGTVLADSDEDPAHMENHADRPELVAAREVGSGAATRWSRTFGQTLMYVTRRTDDRPSPIAFVRVALPLDSVEQQLAEFRRMVPSEATNWGSWPGRSTS
jgi:two-component system phosphate regulon sensor histidine kinase PhoR